MLPLWTTLLPASTPQRGGQRRKRRSRSEGRNPADDELSKSLETVKHLLIVIFRSSSSCSVNPASPIWLFATTGSSNVTIKSFLATSSKAHSIWYLGQCTVCSRRCIWYLSLAQVTMWQLRLSFNKFKSRRYNGLRTKEFRMRNKMQVTNTVIHPSASLTIWIFSVGGEYVRSNGHGDNFLL